MGNESWTHQLSLQFFTQPTSQSATQTAILAGQYDTKRRLNCSSLRMASLRRCVASSLAWLIPIPTHRLDRMDKQFSTISPLFSCYSRFETLSSRLSVRNSQFETPDSTISNACKYGSRTQVKLSPCVSNNPNSSRVVCKQRVGSDLLLLLFTTHKITLATNWPAINLTIPATIDHISINLPCLTHKRVIVAQNSYAIVA